MVQAAREVNLRAWVGLGSNLGNGRKQLEHALRLLNQYPSIEVLRTSSLYRTKPWGVLDQNHFTNAVAELTVNCGAAELLSILKKVELDMGRDPDGRRWGPRQIDLDILLFDGKILHWVNLTVPHPRMHKRAFVLVPLYELEPELMIPSRGTVRSCLARLRGNNTVQSYNDQSGIEQLSEELRI